VPSPSPTSLFSSHGSGAGGAAAGVPVSCSGAGSFCDGCDTRKEVLIHEALEPTLQTNVTDLDIDHQGLEIGPGAA
jgi:hypothetical protein